MKFLILLSAFLATSNYVLAKERRPPGCKDPVYACQDLSTARICGVVSDCIHDIWSTMKVPQDNDEICDICKEMVKEARDQLLSNETQEEIKEVFDGSCELLQIKFVVDECKKIFDALIPEIIETLASRMDPNVVCTVAGLCNNAELKDLSIKDRLSSVLHLFSSALNDGVCDGCKTFLESLKHIVTTVPQDDMKQILYQFCKLTPQITDQCTAFVDQYLPEAYSMILSLDPLTTCKQIGVCNMGNEIGNLPIKYGDDLTCEFCETLVQYLRSVILTNSTKEEFREALLNMCADLKSFKNECKELVNEYFDMIYDFIDKNLDPEKVCTALGLCQSSDERSIPLVKILPIKNMWRGKHPNRKTDILPIQLPDRPLLGVRVIPAKQNTKKNSNAEEEDSSNEIGDEPMKQLPIERMQNPLLTLTRDTECAFGKAIMFFLEKDAPELKTKAISAAFDNVCEKWLPGYMKECDHFVQKNQKKVTELLLVGVPFDSVPSYLDLCSDENKPAVNGLPQVQDNSITCELCMQVIGYVKEEIGDKATEEEIREALDKVCTYLPKSMVQDCQQLVNKYSDMIVQLLLQKMDPSAICSYLELCSGETRKPVKDDFSCELCKEIMAYVKSKLTDPAVEGEIKEVLDEVCSVLPKSWGDECKKFVDQYTGMIITMLVQEVDPDEICSLLGVCPSNAIKAMKTKTATFNPSKAIKAVKTRPATFNPLKGSVDCEICETVMKALESELEDPTVESGIRQALDTVCSVLPSSYAVKCQQFVDKNTDKIIKLLVQNVSPKMVCSLLQECPSESVVCTLCKYTLHFIQQQLMSSSTESELKNLAKKICSYLPDEIADQCDAFIEQYGDSFIVLLAQELDPSVICSMLKLCISKDLPKELPPAPVKDIKLNRCDVCKKVVNYVDQLLEDGNVDKELTDLAAKVCSIFPETTKEECNSIVHLYGPFILQMIGKLETGQQLCQSIDLCPPTPGHVQLLGAEKCTYGPSYWCLSKAHAVACKSEAYCQEMVWKN